MPGREVILQAPTWTTTLRGKLCLCAHIHTMRGVPRRNVWLQAYLCPCTMAASRADEATVSPERPIAPRGETCITPETRGGANEHARNPTPHS